MFKNVESKRVKDMDSSRFCSLKCSNLWQNIRLINIRLMLILEKCRITFITMEPVRFKDLMKVMNGCMPFTIITSPYYTLELVRKHL